MRQGNNADKDQPALTEKLNYLCDQVSLANELVCFFEYIHSNNERLNQSIPNREIRHFLNMTSSSHLVSLSMIVYRIWDWQDDVMSIPSLCHDLKDSSRRQFEGIVAKFKQSEEWRRVYAKRAEGFAHAAKTSRLRTTEPEIGDALQSDLYFCVLEAGTTLNKFSNISGASIHKTDSGVEYFRECIDKTVNRLAEQAH